MAQAAPPRTQPVADRAGLAPAPKQAPAARAARAEELLSTFRRATLEEAVARLHGSIRLIDGMRAEQVEVGPGALVAGADRSRDVVRVVYFDPAGREIRLDQQRIGAPADAVSGARELAETSDLGMSERDTLTTAAPGGQIRLRWIDRGTFWLSLTGTLPPDSLRRLVARVR
jgi:hypothetical protein